MIKFSTPTHGKKDAPGFLPADLLANFAPYTGRQKRTDEQIAEMVASLLANGQEVPITVRKGFKSEAIPVTGHTRILAANRINEEGLTGYRIDPATGGKTQIKYGPENPFVLTAIVRNMNETEALFASFIENADRTDLTPADYALFLQIASTTTQMTDGQIAEKLGKQPSFISNLRKFLTLDIDTQREVLNGGVKFNTAVDILSKIEPTKRAEVVAKAKANNGGKATGAALARAAAEVGAETATKLKRTDAEVKRFLDEQIIGMENKPEFAAVRAFLFGMKDFRAGAIGETEFSALIDALATKEVVA